MEKELRNDRMAVERWKQACKAGSNQSNYRRERGLTETCDDFFVDGVQWADEHPAKTQWRSVEEWPKDKEPILIKLENGKYQYSEWEADGKGFNGGFAEINFGGGAMIRLPIKYRVVAWRPLADVINELNDNGIIKQQEMHHGEAGEGYTLLDRKIVDLPLSVRTVNILKAAGLETLRDMVRMQKTDLLRLRNFSKKSLGEVEDYFALYNLTFGMDV